MTSPQNPFDPPQDAPPAPVPADPAAQPWPYDAPQPAYGQPAYGQPVSSQPAYGQPVSSQPAYGQPGGYSPPNLASPWIRLAACLLNGVLFIVTLGIGYMVWAMVLWAQATNPAKKMLGLKVIHADTGVPVNWNHMAIRSALLPFALAFVPLGAFVDALFIFGPRHQRLVDKAARTLVVTV